ncbi:uncharacterized protein LOC105830822 [Monomorium pharaonis]|uniref:uncharacterized protein LOC105830822 n=1 Tax=Monomorium pharaonis TaxID=307658 RepID=UPI00102E1977|nr:uncharacterized protein LOC105830822 [Monomorium pharaonis]
MYKKDRPCRVVSRFPLDLVAFLASSRRSRANFPVKGIVGNAEPSRRALIGAQSGVVSLASLGFSIVSIACVRCVRMQRRKRHRFIGCAVEYRQDQTKTTNISNIDDEELCRYRNSIRKTAVFIENGILEHSILTNEDLSQIMGFIRSVLWHDNLQHIWDIYERKCCYRF